MTTVRSQWHVFTAAPHRVMMFAGTLQLVATLFIWFIELVGRYSGLWSPLDTTIPMTWAHAFLMLYSLFPLFFFGFLMTTYPRWMNGELVPRARYVASFGTLCAGLLLYYLGLFTLRGIAAAGAALLLVGLGLGILALWRVYRTAPSRDKFYETLLNVSLALGWLGAAAYLGWLLTDHALALQIALKSGLWGFLLPVVMMVAHRMIPFFSNSVLPDYVVFHPRGTALAMVALSFSHGVLELAGVAAWLWVVDVPLAGLALYHNWRWRLARSFQVRLLAMLHVAYLWLGLAMALYGLQSLTLLITGDWILGRGPLHALVIGGIASMTIAMATRVTLGHSGRALVADTLTWVLFWGVAVAALLRIGAEAAGGLNLAAAGAWLAVMTPWAYRYAPIYLRRRADGRPG